MWHTCRIRDGVRERHGVLSGESSRHAGVHPGQLHPRVPAQRSTQVRLLALQNVSQQRPHRSAVVDAVKPGAHYTRIMACLYGPYIIRVVCTGRNFNRVRIRK